MTKAESPKPPIKLETITLKVYIHCEGCRRKVRRIIRILDGVEDVSVDSASGKVTVTGTGLDVKTLLQRLQKYGKHAEVWPSSNPAAPPAAGKAGANQPKPNNNNGPDSGNRKKKNDGGGTDGGNKPAAADTSKKGDGKEAASGGAAAKGKQEPAANESKPDKSKDSANPEAANNAKEATQNGGGGGGGGGKKGGKKGGGNGNNANSTDNSGGAPGSNVPEVPSIGSPSAYVDIPVMGAPPSATSVVVSANRSLAPYDSVQTGFSYHSAEYATHMFSDENANNCSIM